MPSIDLSPPVSGFFACSMMRVFRIQGQGKVKDVGLLGPATVAAAEGVESEEAVTSWVSELSCYHPCITGGRVTHVT